MKQYNGKDSNPFCNIYPSKNEIVSLNPFATNFDLK